MHKLSLSNNVNSHLDGRSVEFVTNTGSEEECIGTKNQYVPL